MPRQFYLYVAMADIKQEEVYFGKAKDVVGDIRSKQFSAVGEV